jgi:uncharacterized repeat protein (TIGR02059 family)
MCPTSYVVWGGASPIITPPAIQSAIISSDGLTLTLTYNEALDGSSVPDIGDFLLNGTSSIVDGVSIVGSTVLLSLDNPAFSGETITISYTPNADPIRSAALVNALPLNLYPVTNGSAVLIEIISVLLLASDAYGDSAVNCLLPRGSSPALDSVSGDQFFAYHATNLPSLTSGKLVVGKISPTDIVTTHNSGITTDAQDSHNFASLAIDGDSDLLISADLHGDPLNFHRLTGGSIVMSAWDIPPIESGATDENSTTYPFFLPLANGDVLFFFRDGSSGEGNLLLKKWKHATNTLVTVQGLVVDGEAIESFYPHNPYWDEARGRLHCGGCWRVTTSLNTNHDQIHFWLETVDDWDTCTAKKADGSNQTLPVTRANAAYAATIPQNSGLTNVGSITIGSDGHPRLWSFRDPGDGFSQLFALRYDGAVWIDSWIPDNVQLRSGIPFSYVGIAGGPNNTPFSSPRSICDGVTDRTVILMRSDSEGPGVYALISEESDLTEWNWRLLDSNPVGFWFGSEDYKRYLQDGFIDTLLQRCKFPDEASIGVQNISRLRFRPKTLPYIYTPPAPYFDPNDYAGCISQIAPRVNGLIVFGQADSDSRYRINEVRNALANTEMFVQAINSDAPNLNWNFFGTRKGGIVATSSNLDFMTCSDAGVLAAITGVNVPLVNIQVVRFDSVTAAQCYWGAGVTGDNTRYLRIGITAAGLPVFERRVAGGAAKTYTGSLGSLSASTNYVITTVFDGANGYMRVNGVQQGAAVDQAFAGTFTPSQLSLLRRWRGGSGDLYFGGVLGEGDFWNAVMSTPDIVSIENALASSHGITF